MAENKLHAMLDPFGIATEAVDELIVVIKSVVDAISDSMPEMMAMFAEIDRERIEKIQAKQRRRVMRMVKIARLNT